MIDSYLNRNTNIKLIFTVSLFSKKNSKFRKLFVAWYKITYQGGNFSPPSPTPVRKFLEPTLQFCIENCNLIKIT